MGLVWRLFWLAVLLGSFYILYGVLSEDVVDGTLVFLTDGKRVNATFELADDPAERERGLMGRQNLSSNHGMLFAFEDEAPRSFWMKGVPIGLDIIFVSTDQRIVNITAATPCADSCPLYHSVSPAQYVIEMNGGFAQNNSIRTGDFVDFTFV